MAEQVSVEGYIDSIVFRNEDNGYTVLNIVEKGKEITCVGTFSQIEEGQYIEAVGEMVWHPVYMDQLKVSSYSVKMPQDVESVKRYLASGNIKGIGAKMAERIVDKFGEDTFKVIEEQPELLAKIKGISMRMAMEISDQVVSKQAVRRAMIFLQEYGINMNLANKIYQQYGDRIYDIIRENPYRLADDMKGVGFRIADEIAQRVGIFSNSDFRIRSGIVYQLYNATLNGHVYLPAGILKSEAESLLQLDIQNFDEFLRDLAMDKKVVVKLIGDEQVVYPFSYYHIEMATAIMLRDLDVKCEYKLNNVEDTIKRIESENGMALDEKQKQAVETAAGHGLCVITGGPGTGKTTTIKAIIKYFEMEGLEIRLAAPTGRAAKRMTETCEYEAQTIHRLLEANGGITEDDKGLRFERNDTNPLEADVLIVDEMSMVDIHLMNSLLKAIMPGTRLILVGDVDQLPSVGPGNVLKDIIHSNRFSCIALERIFRQSSESEIVVNAHKINKGEQVTLNPNSNDFVLINRDTPEKIVIAIMLMLRDRLPKHVGASIDEIQVLTPMRKGMTGVERLNKELQHFLNPSTPDKKEHEVGDVIFREGDKVMQIKNNYQLAWEKRSRYGIPMEEGLGVFNGDTGKIVAIKEFSKEIEVMFDDQRIATYKFDELDELELAYAVTIHKSQGSEYPAVLIPMFQGPAMLMSRNLLYTAVTRAKKCVCMVGSEQVFRDMIDNAVERKRYSSLDLRINEVSKGD